MEQKIKQIGIDIGGNIRRIRLEKRIGQTELVRLLQLQNVDMTRESLVKIERGIQHITGAQLRGIRNCLDTSYDELPLLLSVKQLVDLMGVSDSTIYELIQEDDFPSLRIGNRVVVPKDHFRQWVEDHIGK